jgi:ABC-type histidine transport system ATPase subunit
LLSFAFKILKNIYIMLNKNSNIQITDESGMYALEVKNIHKSFGTRHVLKGIDLKAKKGDVISILGTSGSGKSTFLRCINLLETPDQGEIILAGESLELISHKQTLIPKNPKQIEAMRAKLGMVFQGFNLWAHMTVLENIIEAPIHVLKKTRAQFRNYAFQRLRRDGRRTTLGDHDGPDPSDSAPSSARRCRLGKRPVYHADGR